MSFVFSSLWATGLLALSGPSAFAVPAPVNSPVVENPAVPVDLPTRHVNETPANEMPAVKTQGSHDSDTQASHEVDTQGSHKKDPGVPVYPATETWSDLARRFTGESDEVREHALAALRTTPGLTSALRAALDGPDKFLALDVIAALPVPVLYADLMRFSENDPTGYSVHALNALVTPENRAEVAAAYRARVMRPTTAPPAKIALLDTLARLQTKLATGDLASLLADPSYEVRESAIAYVRTSVRSGEGAGYVALLARPLREGPFQLRLQVLSLAAELSRGFTRRLSPAWESVLTPCGQPDRFTPPLLEDERALCAKAAPK